MADQGVDKKGTPQEGVYMPGMDIKAALTVVADGPVGAVGRALDEKFGLPPGHHRNDWGIGMKASDEGITNPHTWRGVNQLGFALMEVREMLMSQ